MGFIKAAVALQALFSSVATALPAGPATVETDASSLTVYDAVVVGGGPAGLSAGEYPMSFL